MIGALLINAEPEFMYAYYVSRSQYKNLVVIN